MSAKNTTWIWNSIDVRDFRNAVVKIWTSWSANMNIKCQGAIVWPTNPNTAPVFSASQSIGNHWNYIQMVNLDDGGAITGSTWITYTGTDWYYTCAINIDNLDYINFEVTARSAGVITIDIQLSDNQ